MIELEHVYLSYTKEFYTLYDVSFKVEKGKTAVLLGPAESGKSTLIRLICGMEKPTLGTIFVNHHEPSKINYKTGEFSLGYLPKGGVFKENKTVYQNLMLPLKIRKIDKSICAAKVTNALNSYDLQTLANQPLRSLQAFDRLKVALARFSMRPIDLFLIDDIFSLVGEDDAVVLAKYVAELIKNNAATAVVACSDKKFAKYFKGDVIRLEQGSITA